MAAAPALCAFSFSTMEPLLLSSAWSAAAGNSRRGCRRASVCISAASGAMLPGDFGLQYQTRQEGLAKVRKQLHRGETRGREVVATVDNLKRLCIDHHFQEEIEASMETCVDFLHSGGLLDATLAFRLLREAGRDVSADDTLGRFTNGSGEFSLALSKDTRGLLSLYDMSHLDMGGEASLGKAKEFSREHLSSAVGYLQEPGLARYVRQSLDHPYHLSLMQYKARHHLSYLQSLPIRNTAVEELAIAEFQLNKLLHQAELQEIKRWWMNLGLAQEIPVARDQVLKWYMWTMTVLEGSSFSKFRVDMTKIISLVYVADDIFDLIGTPEELSLFTQAVKMWDIAAADSLPNCIRSCYQAIYTVTNEIAYIAEMEHGLNPVKHLSKAWAVLFDGFMVESKWLATNQVPAAEDYLRNGVVTSGVPLAFAHISALLGYDHAAANSTNAANLTDDYVPSLVSCLAKILRLLDDMGSAKNEAQEGLDGSYIEFYLMENPSCGPGDAEKHMRGLIAREWQELNKECFTRRSFLGSSLTQACLNAARMISVMYSYDKDQRLLVLEEYAMMLLL